MSRKRKAPISRNRNVTPRWIGRDEISDDMPEISEFLSVRDPQVMGPLLQALSPRRALFSCLPPGTRVIGVPAWAGEDLPWLTIVDDLHAAAAGPTSFDPQSLEWWATRASLLFIDAATPQTHIYSMLGKIAAEGHLVFIVQTVEARRPQWHEYFVSVCSPTLQRLVMHQLRCTQPGKPAQVIRMGGLGDDFASDRPVVRPSAWKARLH
jgi:hypothetical protein